MSVEGLESVKADFLAALSSAEDPGQVRNRYLDGKGSVLRTLFAGMGKLPPDEKAVAGRELNALRSWMEGHLAGAKAPSPAARVADPTLPGKVPPLGRLHPIQQTLDEIIGVFRRLGFDVVDGPEVEHEKNNFEALNIPMEHPSRDAFDTFYLEAPWLLRSHTTSVQARLLRKSPNQPVRAVSAGRVYRPDKADASHLPAFHQVDAVSVGEGITFAQLKGLLMLFAESMFGAGTKVRFRPSHFPFTEPSAEVDISCFLCGASGCPACKQSGWMEILGSGMIHPRVLSMAGYDAERFTGYALGMGVERICMLRHGVTDIRYFVENHFRFLEQF